jgi:peptidoglycan/LPS O-acetylase OafA/YrhL
VGSILVGLLGRHLVEKPLLKRLRGATARRGAAEADALAPARAG